jgi:hypothetical protein
VLEPLSREKLYLKSWLLLMMPSLNLDAIFLKEQSFFDKLMQVMLSQ